MKFDKLLARIRGILLQPNREWPRIAAEADTTPALYMRYILLLAALPPLFQFIRYSLIGDRVGGTHVRYSFFGGIWGMLVGYAASLVLVYLIALIVNALAETFEGRRDFVQALKTVAYAWTAAWVAGIFVVLPWLGFLITLAGALYAFYLLYLGLPHTMRCPRERSLGYAVLSTVLAILLSWILLALLGLVTGTGLLSPQHQAMNATPASGTTSTAAAQNPGQASTPDPDRMRALLPATLDGYARASASALRQDTPGARFSLAQALYRDTRGNHIQLLVLDTANADTMPGLGIITPASLERSNDSGFEKTRLAGDRSIGEQWNSTTRQGTYALAVDNRILVRASGTVKDFDDLKHAVRAVDLTSLKKVHRDPDTTP